MNRIGTARLAAALVLLTAARSNAQMRTAPASRQEDRGYIEFVAQSAFGNVTSQCYGVEAGGSVGHGVQIFGEFGNIRNIATPEISAAAQQIAGALSQVQSAAVTYNVKQPVTFFGGGVRFSIPTQSGVRPYVLGGYGVAKVKNDVTFQLGGTDATSTLPQYVTLGSDLTGDVSKPMLTLGGGVVWPAWKSLILDFGYRYGRIFMEKATTTNRAGLGIGVRF
jgi:opacity protein-like surface antigen